MSASPRSICSIGKTLVAAACSSPADAVAAATVAVASTVAVGVGAAVDAEAAVGFEVAAGAGASGAVVAMPSGSVTSHPPAARLGGSAACAKQGRLTNGCA